MAGLSRNDRNSSDGSASRILFEGVKERLILAFVAAVVGGGGAASILNTTVPQPDLNELIKRIERIEATDSKSIERVRLLETLCAEARTEIFWLKQLYGSNKQSNK